ncbi:MAG TPA: hypothetical protein VGI17_05670 [Solirubrobacterales bacterium]|jgi:acyl-CoA thioester hydrolase
MIEETGYRSVVYPWQCDHMGHLNIMWCVGKFEEATLDLFAWLGMTGRLDGSSHARPFPQGLVTHPRRGAPVPT